MENANRTISELQEYHNREWTDEREGGLPAREERRRITGNALELLQTQKIKIGLLEHELSAMHLLVRKFTTCGKESST